MIESYSSPQNPKRTQSSSGSHLSGIRLRSSFRFKKRSNVPSSLLTTSRTLFVPGESFRVRLTRYLDRIMHLRCCYRKRAISHIRDYLCNDDFYQLQSSCINQTYKGHPEGESKAISEALKPDHFLAALSQR